MVFKSGDSNPRGEFRQTDYVAHGNVAETFGAWIGRFDSKEAAESLARELGDGYRVVRDERGYHIILTTAYVESTEDEWDPGGDQNDNDWSLFGLPRIDFCRVTMAMKAPTAEYLDKCARTFRQKYVPKLINLVHEQLQQVGPFSINDRTLAKATSADGLPWSFQTISIQGPGVDATLGFMRWQTPNDPQYHVTISSIAGTSIQEFTTLDFSGTFVASLAPTKAFLWDVAACLTVFLVLWQLILIPPVIGWYLAATIPVWGGYALRLAQFAP